MYRFVPETEIGERYILDPNIDTVINYTPEDTEKNKLSADAAEIISREILKSRIKSSTVVLIFSCCIVSRVNGVVINILMTQVFAIF